MRLICDNIQDQIKPLKLFPTESEDLQQTEIEDLIPIQTRDKYSYLKDEIRFNEQSSKNGVEKIDSDSMKLQD